jgi:DNA replication protein DnaC
VLAAKLVNELVEAADEKQLSKTIARYGRVDLLCIDELGYLVDRLTLNGTIICAPWQAGDRLRLGGTRQSAGR